MSFKNDNPKKYYTILAEMIMSPDAVILDLRNEGTSTYRLTGTPALSYTAAVLRQAKNKTPNHVNFRKFLEQHRSLYENYSRLENLKDVQLGIILDRIKSNANYFRVDEDLNDSGLSSFNDLGFEARDSGFIDDCFQ